MPIMPIQDEKELNSSFRGSELKLNQTKPNQTNNNENSKKTIKNKNKQTNYVNKTCGEC